MDNAHVASAIYIKLMSTSRSPCAFLCPPRGRFGTALRPCRSSVVWRDAPSGQPALFSCMDARQRPPGPPGGNENKKHFFRFGPPDSQAMPDHHPFELTWLPMLLMMFPMRTPSESSSDRSREMGTMELSDVSGSLITNGDHGQSGGSSLGSWSFTSSTQNGFDALHDSTIAR